MANSDNVSGTVASPTKTPAAVRSRMIERRIQGQATSDGAGVKLTRLLTQDLQIRLDPFLMLDRFATDHADDYIAGFPEHPHRGFETVTIMLAGRMRHRDNTGGEGLLQSGGVQWMTAGQGIVHSEMPEQESGRMEGFQLWLNLPAADKMCAAGYRDIAPSDIPFVTPAPGVNVRVIAGQSHGVNGAVERPFTEPLILDIELPDGATFEQSMAPDLNAFVVVYRGAVIVGEGDAPLAAGSLAILDNVPASNGVRLQAMGSGENARLILVAGSPLREPIVQYGPFVMNTQAQIVEAVNDYRAGRFGQRPIDAA